MNISQTQQVLSYIWSTHPSAPKYSDDGKTRIIASYFRVLYKYSIDDVLDAVDRVCHESPTFIPSAYEIEKQCHKTVDVDMFLPPEFSGLAEEISHAERRMLEAEPSYNEAFRERSRLLGGVIWDFLSDERKTEMDAKVAPLNEAIENYHRLLDEFRRLKDRERELFNRAERAAYDDYDKTQTTLARNDLCQLGYGRLALE